MNGLSVCDDRAPSGKRAERRYAFETDLFKTLAHPLCLELLEILVTGERSVSELRQALGLDRPVVSRALAVLRARHIVEARKDGPTARYAVQDPLIGPLLEVARRVLAKELAGTRGMRRAPVAHAPRRSLDLPPAPDFNRPLHAGGPPRTGIRARPVGGGRRARARRMWLGDLPRRRTRRRVISGSMFHREVALLNWRLRELAAVVDEFVVVEATVTHSGKPRDLVRPDRLPLFADMSGHLHGIVVDGLPEGPDPWSREQKQREAIWTMGAALLATSDDDLVIVSDLDEVPFPEVVDRLAFSRLKAPLQLRPHWFNFDWNTYLGGWAHASIRVYTAGFLRRLFAAGRGVEFGNGAVPAREIEGLCGWHASWFGDDELILDKLASYAHATDPKDRLALARGANGLRRRRAAGFDMFGERRKLDRRPRLPAYAFLLA
jgi:DNA-binding transcriptional ArsR family regulator